MINTGSSQQGGFYMNYITLNNGVKMPQLGYGVYATQTALAPDGRRIMTAWIYTPQSAEDITFAADGKATITAEQFELNP